LRPKAAAAAAAAAALYTHIFIEQIKVIHRPKLAPDLLSCDSSLPQYLLEEQQDRDHGPVF
jgi:hypothetical protein